MPVTYYEVADGSATTVQLATGVGYCTVGDVQALTFARSIGVGSNPGPSQVTTYIQMVAGEIDAVLWQKGYSVPVNAASWPAAGALLNSINAKGAWAMLESSAPNSINLDRAKAAYDESLKLLADAKFTIQADTNTQTFRARAPWITTQPTGHTFDPVLSQISGTPGDGISGANQTDSNPADPYFSRQMRFRWEPAGWDDVKAVPR